MRNVTVKPELAKVGIQNTETPRALWFGDVAADWFDPVIGDAAFQFDAINIEAAGRGRLPLHLARQLATRILHRHNEREGDTFEPRPFTIEPRPFTIDLRRFKLTGIEYDKEGNGSATFEERPRLDTIGDEDLFDARVHRAARHVAEYWNDAGSERDDISLRLRLCLNDLAGLFKKT